MTRLYTGRHAVAIDKPGEINTTVKDARNYKQPGTDTEQLGPSTAADARNISPALGIKVETTWQIKTTAKTGLDCKFRCVCYVPLTLLNNLYATDIFHRFTTAAESLAIIHAVTDLDAHKQNVVPISFTCSKLRSVQNRLKAQNYIIRALYQR